MLANSKGKVIKEIFLSIFINGVIPSVIYNVLLSYYPSLISLMIAITIPLLDNLYHILKEKQVDAFAMFMLTGFILSVLALFLGGNEKMILLRESFVTAICGLIFIGSLFFPKPLIYYFAIRFNTGGGPEEKEVFEESWKLPYFRFVMRLMTAVWGGSLLSEAMIKVILVFKLTITAFLAVSQLVFYGSLGLTIAWTVLYRKHAIKRITILRKQSESYLVN